MTHRQYNNADAESARFYKRVAAGLQELGERVPEIAQDISSEGRILGFFRMEMTDLLGRKKSGRNREDVPIFLTEITDAELLGFLASNSSFQSTNGTNTIWAKLVDPLNPALTAVAKITPGEEVMPQIDIIEFAHPETPQFFYNNGPRTTHYDLGSQRLPPVIGNASEAIKHTIKFARTALGAPLHSIVQFNGEMGRGEPSMRANFPSPSEAWIHPEIVPTATQNKSIEHYYKRLSESLNSTFKVIPLVRDF